MLALSYLLDTTKAYWHEEILDSASKKLSSKQKIVKRVKTILENGRNYSQSTYKTVVIIKKY